jgi:hypothetical protein
VEQATLRVARFNSADASGSAQIGYPARTFSRSTSNMNAPAISAVQVISVLLVGSQVFVSAPLANSETELELKGCIANLWRAWETQDRQLAESIYHRSSNRQGRQAVAPNALGVLRVQGSWSVFGLNRLSTA